MNAAERHARKQVLLTRIAFTRQELRRDIAQAKQAAQVPRLLRTALGRRLGVGLPSLGANGDWFGTALAWLRRYRLAAGLFGGVMPLLRGGGRWRWLLRGAALAGAGWLGWNTWRDRQTPGR